MARRSKKDVSTLAAAAAKAELRRRAAIARIERVMQEYFAAGETMLFFRLFKRLDRFQKLSDLFDELDAVTEWCTREPDVRWDPASIRNGLVLRFLDKFVDGDGLYSAKFFEDQYGIRPSRLRKAVQRGRLKAHKHGTQTLYAMVEVRRLWPEDTLFLPSEA